MNNCNPDGGSGAGTAAGGGGDAFDLGTPARHFDRSATAWLVGQAVAHLNRDDDEGAHGYRQVTELLAAREDAFDTLAGLHERVPDGDVGLRWNLLYLLGEVGDAAGAEFLAKAALQRLPEHNPKLGCEGPRDGELLLRTMAIEALVSVARRQPKVAPLSLEIVKARPEWPVLVEAVKAAVALGLADRLRELLPQNEHWLIELKTVRHEELSADTGRKDLGEVGNRVPRLFADATTPTRGCGCHGG
jgi:hypothetical protein